MKYNAKLAKAGLTPAKMALIGVLGVVLVVVVVIQIPGGSAPKLAAGANDPAAPAPAASRTNQRAASQRPNNRQIQPSQSDPSDQPVRRSWPARSLQSALAHDPFAAPAWTRPPGEIDNSLAGSVSDEIEQDTSAADRQLLADLRATGVSLVMIAGDQRVAHIGERKIHEGDLIGGFVVQEINTNGVVLVEQPTP